MRAISKSLIARARYYLFLFFDRFNKNRLRHISSFSRRIFQLYYDSEKFRGYYSGQKRILFPMVYIISVFRVPHTLMSTFAHIALQYNTQLFCVQFYNTLQYNIHNYFVYSFPNCKDFIPETFLF